MTIRDLSAALLDLGYDLPIYVLTTWRKKKVQKLYRWVRYRQNEITPVGRPVRGPLDLEAFRIQGKARRMR
jgi:hypothetical protein